jgi:MFS family permease
MLMGVISSVVRIITVPYWGRIADNRSWIDCTKYSIALLALCHLLWFFVNSSTMLILVPLVHIIGGVAWAGINIALFNIQFIFSPKEGRTMYLGANAAIGGLLGFVSTIIGSSILKLLDGKNFGGGLLSFNNMQILFALSGILLGICAVYVHEFLKEKPVRNI